MNQKNNKTAIVAKVLKVLAITYLLALATLFVLNGRYEAVGGNRLMFDKWTREIIYKYNFVHSNGSEVNP